MKMSELKMKFIETVSKLFDDFVKVKISNKHFCDTSKILTGMNLKYRTNDLRHAHKVFKLWNDKEIETEIKKRIEVRLGQSNENAGESTTSVVGTPTNINKKLDESMAETVCTPTLETISKVGYQFSSHRFTQLLQFLNSESSPDSEKLVK